MTEEEIVKIASQVAIEAYEKRYEDELHKRRERARQNTKRLLRGYNEMKEHCEHAVADTENSIPSDLQLILAEVFDRKGRVKVESIVASKRRTELILEHVDCMLSVYKTQCSRRGSSNFDVLMKYYVWNEPIEDIACQLDVVERTAYRYLEQAEQDLSILLWGVQAA